MTRQPQRGFTLIEMMISLVIFSFAIAGVLAVAVSMSQGFREQRAAVGAEGAVRVPIDFLGDVLRQASPGAPTLNIQDVSTCATGALTITNNYGGNGWDQLDVIYASGAVVTSLRTGYALGVTTVTVNDASQLAAGDYIVISNLGQGHIVQITAVAGSVLTLAPQCGTILFPGGGYPAGSIVIRAQHSIFFIALVNAIPTLMMNPTGNPATNATAGEPLAEGIEDLQVAIGVDTNGDNAISESGLGANDDEWQGNFAGDNVLVGNLRAIRVTLVARTTSNYTGAALVFKRPAAEDNPAATAFDSYRRRVLQTTVEIRNLSGSP